MTARLTASFDWMLRGQPPETCFPILREMGFEAVEFCFPYDHSPDDVRDLLVRNGLDMSLMYVPAVRPPEGWGLAGLPGHGDEWLESVAAGIVYAQKVGCKVLATLPGSIPPGADRAPFEETLIANLGKATALLKKAGMVMSLEPVSGERAPNLVLRTTDQAARVIAAVGDDTIGICFDTLHAALERGSVIAAAKQHRDLINYIQIGNVPARGGPGEGELDIPAILDEILPDTRSGWLSCEYLVRDYSDPAAVMAWAGRFVDAGLLRW